MGDVKLLADIGHRVSVRRKELNLTQEQVAEQMDVSVQMISNLELGRKAIRPENLIKICRILDVSTDYILTGQRSGDENIKLAQEIGKLPEHQRCLIEQLVASLLQSCG